MEERASSFGKREHPEGQDAGSSKAAKTAEEDGPGTKANSDGQRTPAPAEAPAAAAGVWLSCAASSDRGTRTAMEDVHVCLLDTNRAPEAATGASGGGGAGKGAPPRVAHFAVLDGHGGADCARFAAGRLHEAVLAAGLLTRRQEAGGAGGGQGGRWQLDVKAAKQAIAKGFAQVDAELLAECERRRWLDGATAVAAWVVGETALVANVGDAKAVLARVSDKGQLRAVVLTKEHLSMYPAERARIAAAGGHVSADGRLNGRLQVSRSFGDSQFKPFGCSAQPDVTAFKLACGRDRFLLCGCDGLFSVLDPQTAVELAAQQLDAGADLKAATNRLVHEAVVQRRCKDNCTALLVRFEQRPPGAKG